MQRRNNEKGGSCNRIAVSHSPLEKMIGFRKDEARERGGERLYYTGHKRRDALRRLIEKEGEKSQPVRARTSNFSRSYTVYIYIYISLPSCIKYNGELARVRRTTNPYGYRKIEKKERKNFVSRCEGSTHR